MPFNLNKGNEERDEFERFVAAMLVMELVTAQAHYHQLLEFAIRENWARQKREDIIWKLEVIKGEFGNRGLRF